MSKVKTFISINSGIITFFSLLILSLIILYIILRNLGYSYTFIPIFAALSIFLFNQFYTRPPYLEVINFTNKGSSSVKKSVKFELFNSGSRGVVIKRIWLEIIDSKPSELKGEWLSGAIISKTQYTIFLDPSDNKIIVEEDDPFDLNQKEIMKFGFDFYSMQDFTYSLELNFDWVDKSQQNKEHIVSTETFKLIYSIGQSSFYTNDPKYKVKKNENFKEDLYPEIKLVSSQQ